MIKVNLLRNRIGEQTQTAQTSAASSNPQFREGVVKMACIFIFTILLMVFESQNIRSLNEESGRLQAQMAQMQVEADAKMREVEAVKDIEVQAKELEDKLKILKLLSKLRLREVKTLDFMQSSIPEKVWLKGISYDSDKVRVEQGHFTFTGNAVATEELTEFVRRMEESAYLSEVIVVKNVDVTLSKSTSLRDFLFTAEVENKN